MARRFKPNPQPEGRGIYRNQDALSEKEGSPNHPDDPYTVESVRSALFGLLEQLAAGQG